MDGDILVDPTEYRRVIGSLQYLTLTRLEIAFSIKTLYQFMSSLSKAQCLVVKRY